MELSSWAWLQLTSKLFIYFGLAVAVAYPYQTWMTRQSPDMGRYLQRFGTTVIVIALVASGLHYSFQIGALSDTGFSGMWDPLMHSVLWQSNAGRALIWKGFGFIVALIGILIFRLSFLDRQRILIPVLLFLYATSSASLAFSFSIGGHVAELTIHYKFLIGIHVIAMAWWIGALWPLRRACYYFEAEELFNLMHRFGMHALYFVLLLVVSGGVLAWRLFDSWQNLLHSSYGFIFLLKLTLVAAILSLAALHKLRLVPKLTIKENGPSQLALSIGFEMVVAISILMVATVLTTVVGPSHS